jgi:hypothetical protein
MQGAGPKVPGIGSAVAEEMQSHQRAAPSLRTGYGIFRRGVESCFVWRYNGSDVQ